MPFLGSVSGARSGRIFSLGGKPAQISTPSLSDGCTTATFSWSAPQNNGIPITKYGYQTSSDNGSTWSAETETASTSFSLDVNNNVNSYKTRVRAYNAAGWGEYSSISSGTTAWTYESYSDPASCTDSTGCDGCGTKTGTKYRTCYRYVRSGCTTTSGLSCGSYGSCGELGGCSDSWTSANIFSPTCYPLTNGTHPYAAGSIFGWLYYTDSGCQNAIASCQSGGLIGPENVEYCSTSGLYRVTGTDQCIYPSCC